MTEPAGFGTNSGTSIEAARRAIGTGNTPADALARQEAADAASAQVVLQEQQRIAQMISTIDGNLGMRLDTLSIEDLIQLGAQMAHQMDANIKICVGQINTSRTQASALAAASQYLNTWNAANHNGGDGAGFEPASRTVAMQDAQGNPVTPSPTLQDVLDQGYGINRSEVEAAVRGNMRGAPDVAIEATVNRQLATLRQQNGVPTERILPSNVGNVLSSISDRSAEINSGSEMRTMKLQQAVSQRSEFLQTISQIITATNDTDKSIVGNIGR